MPCSAAMRGYKRWTTSPGDNPDSYASLRSLKSKEIDVMVYDRVQRAPLSEQLPSKTYSF